MSNEITWEQALVELRRMIDREGFVLTAVASELDVTHSALTRILDGTTKNPHSRTKKAIIRFVLHYRRRGGEQYPAGIESPAGGPPGAEASPEQELLEYFLENHPQMASFLSVTTEGLTPEERRQTALVILNGFKRMAIRAGEPIPPFIFELERKFVAE